MSVPYEIPNTKIKIHHKFDSSLHYNHKSNQVLRKINGMIKLIFKNTKETSEPKNVMDEKRVKEIQKISQAMKFNIPNKFESNMAIREFIQSREFVTGIKHFINL